MSCEQNGFDPAGVASVEYLGALYNYANDFDSQPGRSRGPGAGDLSSRHSSDEPAPCG